MYYSQYSPYYHQISAVLLADGWVSLTQLQMISDHGGQQEGGAYMYERESERGEGGEAERESERERDKEMNYVPPITLTSSLERSFCMTYLASDHAGCPSNINPSNTGS